ncbi:MAG TPA: BlaI/MecI/CopY family transcriptional regulator [Caproiciproducens sp.]|nr:BlaI/MecI/CopY family transcriptional regulator [Caproiciproducens sp.]
MNNGKSITNAEQQVMEVIWENNTIPSTEIVRQVKSTTGWKDNTIYTLLSRLAKKKMIRIDKQISPSVCTPLITQQEFQSVERKSFVQKVYNGSLSLMLANIIEEENLTTQDIEQLKEILDRKNSEIKKVP